MRLSRMVLVAAVLVVFATPLIAQDPAVVGAGIYKCVFDNERMRVCEVKFKPGESIAMHSHPAHLVYVVAPGKLRITGPAGAQEADFKAGATFWTPAPETHSAVNTGKTELRGLVIELKEPPPMTDEQALMQLERDWGAAMGKNDYAAMRRIMAPEWTMTGPDGSRSTFDASMRDLQSGDLRFESMEPSDFDVKVYGDTAVVTGQSKDKGTYKGQDISGTYRFTDVFVKRDGKWVAVSTHVTRVADGNDMSRMTSDRQ